MYYEFGSDSQVCRRHVLKFDKFEKLLFPALKNNLMNKELKYYLQQSFQLPGSILEMQDAENFLGDKMNHLISTDFNHLIQVLYRIDVSETKLKQVLKDNPNEDAGKIIARLIIERQQQKMISRNSFKKSGEDIDEEEKW